MNLIDRLKQNKEAFGLMDADLRLVAEKIKPKSNYFEIFRTIGCWSRADSGGFQDDYTYRLRADYVCQHPETKNVGTNGRTGQDIYHCVWCNAEIQPEKTAGWDLVPVFVSSSNYHFKHPHHGSDHHLGFAQSIMDFGGIQFKDCCCADKPSLQDVWLMDFPKPCDKCGPHQPVSVRFWKEK